MYHKYEKGPKPLPKKIVSEMNKREITQYERLVREWVKTGEEMVKAQAESSIYSRKLDKVKEPTATQRKKEQKLIDAGFRTEYRAFKKSDEYEDFKKKVQKKYA